MLSELLAPIAEFVSTVIETFGYPGIFFITFIENVIAPIPSEFVFPWAGFLATEGKFNVWMVSFVGALGATVAALLLYFLGSLFNGPKSREFIDKYGKYLFISLDDLDRAEKWFDKYGVFTVFFFRFVPIMRSIISIPAGFVRMNIWLFIVFTFLGSFIWCLALTYAGFILGENFELVIDLLGKYEKVALLALLLIGFGFIYKKRHAIPLISRVDKKKVKPESSEV